MYHLVRYCGYCFFSIKLSEKYFTLKYDFSQFDFWFLSSIQIDLLNGKHTLVSNEKSVKAAKKND